MSIAYQPLLLSVHIGSLIIFSALLQSRHVLGRTKVEILAPVTDPEKVICIGMNYSDHCAEQNIAIPTVPIVFSKFPNAITHPGYPIIYPAQTEVR